MKSNVIFNREAMKIELPAHCDPCELDLQECTDPAHLLDLIFHLAESKVCAPLVPEFLVCLDQACQEVFNNNARGVYFLSSTDRVIDWQAGTSTIKR